MPAHYAYLSFTLDRGRQAWTSFLEHVRDVAAPVVAAEEGEVLGVFQGQLGFASNEAIVFLRFKSATRDRLRELDRAPCVVSMHPQVLTATVRPKDDAALKAGGIYVHRWFTVDADAVAKFVELSNSAWKNFEGTYATEIFGLFTAERTAQDIRDGAGRLLLLTYYASHGVWEESRDQTRDPSGFFAQRHALTRSTIGRSSLLLPLRRA